MQNHKVWTYWENAPGKSTPPYIDYCLESIKKYCSDLVIITPENVDSFVKNLHPNWKALQRIAHRADAVRVAVIAEHGGIWIDADTLFIADINEFQNTIKNEKDFLFCRWDDGRILNGYFYGGKKSPIMLEWLKQINARLSKGTNFGWTALGEAIISPLAFGKYRSVCEEFKRQVFLPVNIDRIPFVFLEPISFAAFVQKDTVAIGLNHSWMCDNFPDIINKSIEEIVKDFTLFSSFFVG